jgi:ferredoxin hydrogenase
MITSSCSSWIDYAQVYHPELLGNISTCKVPVQMHSALVKTYFANEKGFDTSKIVTVSIGNCTSVRKANNDPLNIDFNIPLNELMMLFKDEEIDFNAVTKSDYDSLLSEGSGSGYLTCVSGGGSEAFVRTFYRIMKKDKLKNDEVDFVILRKINGIRSANIQIGDYKLRIAVVEGLANFEKLVMNDKLKHYHYIEVMNCKNGCIGGSGKIISSIEELDKELIYEKDRKMSKRCSHDNKEIKNIYSKYLSRPLGEKCLEILHCGYKDNSNLLKDK